MVSQLVGDQNADAARNVAARLGRGPHSEGSAAAENDEVAAAIKLVSEVLLKMKATLPPEQMRHIHRTTATLTQISKNT